MAMISINSGHSSMLRAIDTRYDVTGFDTRDVGREAFLHAAYFRGEYRMAGQEDEKENKAREEDVEKWA